METKMRKYILSKGLILGGITSVLLLLQYVIDRNLLLNWWTGIIVGTGIPIVYIVFAVRAYREKLNESYLEFKEAFSVSFGISAVMAFVYAFTSILLYNVIDPSMVDFMVDGIQNEMLEWMESFNTPKEEIDKAMRDMGQISEGFKPLGLLKSSCWGLTLWAVLSLLIAAATKKARPMFDDDTLN